MKILKKIVIPFLLIHLLSIVIYIYQKSLYMHALFLHQLYEKENSVAMAEYRHIQQELCQLKNYEKIAHFATEKLAMQPITQQQTREFVDES